MGSVAERVVRTAPCPVLTVRHPQHEFVIAGRLAVRHTRLTGLNPGIEAPHVVTHERAPGRP
jgi:hypothetical protein